jgi:hypothetical protein
MKTTLIAAVLLASLGGCATHAQQQTDRISNQLKAADMAFGACLDETLPPNAKSVLSQQFIIGRGVFRDDDPQKIQKMMIDAYANSEEKATFVAVHAKKQRCREQFIQASSVINPEFVGVHARLFAANDERLVKLLKNEISVGEYNRKEKQTVLVWFQEYQEIATRMHSQLRQSHEYEMAQRQRSALALQAWSYQQQQLDNARRSTATDGSHIYRFPGGTMNCNTFGNITNCR